MLSCLDSMEVFMYEEYEDEEVKPNQPLKYLKPGSVARFREMYYKIVNTPLTPEQRKELLEVFGKKETDKNEKIKQVIKNNKDLRI
jgi:hypothetical protein